jgi:hypothetical protein
MRHLRGPIMSLLSLVAMLIVTGCANDTLTQPGRRLAPTAVPNLATVYNDVRVPLNGLVSNPCNGEPVAFSGYGHFSFHVTYDVGGGLHVSQHFNTQGIEGVGQITGASYSGNEADNSEFNVKYGEEETIEQHFSVISHGKEPNFVLHVIEHFTFNANGELTVFFSDFSADCRG